MYRQHGTNWKRYLDALPGRTAKNCEALYVFHQHTLDFAGAVPAQLYMAIADRVQSSGAA